MIRLGLALALIAAAPPPPGAASVARPDVSAPRVPTGVAAAAAPAWPQDAHPALWVVHGAKGTVYLFGSIHLLPPGVRWLEGSVARAFATSDALELETLTPDPATLRPLVAQLAGAPDGKPLSGKIGPATTAAMDRVLGAGFAAKPLQPWFAGLMVSVVEVMKLGLDPEQGVEKTLTHRAEAAHKAVGGIETAAEQLGFFAHLSQPRQIAFLREALGEADDAPRELHAMVADWARGDPDALAAALNKQMDDDPQLKALLLTDRNAKFARWIAARLTQPGTVFLAVGAGHLAGPGSVQADLALMGVKVERVR